VNVGLPSETIKAAASRILELERENAALRKNFMFAESEIILLREDREELRELAARMAKEMRETDHEFCSLVDYDNLQNKI
jgi:2,3-bisphosphoglycerate-independent phosphoglycerate mutase